MSDILIVGAADTGRAPLAAALLRHLLELQGVTAAVGSAGVIGHEGDELQPQALLTLENLGLQSPQHKARLLTAELAESTSLLLAIDRGTARVLMVRYLQLADHIAALPQLANTRDVPDPFHMTLDAWMVYGRAIQEQLRSALPEILRRINATAPEAGAGGAVASEAAAPLQPAPEARAAVASSDRAEQVARLRRLLDATATAPEIIDWARARAALIESLALLSSTTQPGDMTSAVTALLQGLLAQLSDVPSSGQLSWLAEISAVLAHPVDAQEMARVAADAASWATL